MRVRFKGRVRVRVSNMDASKPSPMQVAEEGPLCRSYFWPGARGQCHAWVRVRVLSRVGVGARGSSGLRILTLRPWEPVSLFYAWVE